MEVGIAGVKEMMGTGVLGFCGAEGGGGEVGGGWKGLFSRMLIFLAEAEEIMYHS